MARKQVQPALPDKYRGRGQVYVKHIVLREYLQKLAYKVGSFSNSINYIDGFSGPWQHQAADLSDTSPYIAARELSIAKNQLARRGRDVRMRCLFVEENEAAFGELSKFAARSSNVEMIARHGKFEAQIEVARTFALEGSKPFAFVFIDPTGWTGFGMEQIKPLLTLKNVEVLVNFMLKDISRFVDDSDSTALASFVDLFGDAEYRAAWRGLEGIEREDAIVAAYRKRLVGAGGFSASGSAIILNPEDDRTHYHLVYATRNLNGLTTFREAERKAMDAQRTIRSDSKLQRKAEKTGQSEMFRGHETERSHVERLQDRYRTKAKDATVAFLRRVRAANYKELVSVALEHPMTSERELKAWVKEWKLAGLVVLEGLPAGARVPSLRNSCKVVWKGD